MGNKFLIHLYINSFKAPDAFKEGLLDDRYSPETGRSMKTHLQMLKDLQSLPEHALFTKYISKYVLDNYLKEGYTIKPGDILGGQRGTTLVRCFKVIAAGELIVRILIYGDKRL